jgi:DNA-binding CsgD family transcriptional regulator/tetratricopeptide (TPR) repeat protein
VPGDSFDHLPLIGREALLTWLRGSLLPPFGDPLAIIIEGPGGIGKTTVLRAGVAQAEAAGVTVLLARPVEAEATYTYAALVDLLGPHLSAIAGRLPPVHVSVLRRALGLGEPEPTSDASDPPDAQRVGMAVLAGLRALIGRGPVLVAIDDAPWVDPASRDALAFTFRRVGDLPLRLLVGQRAEAPGGPLPFELDDTVRPVPMRREWLEPLSMGALHQLVRATTGTSFTRPTLRRIHELSGGNPFYARELARAAAGANAPLRPGQDLPLPSTLRAALGEHLAALPPATRSALLIAALSARPTLSLLHAWTAGDPLPTIGPALDAGLVRIEAGLVAFVHPLYGSTLLAETAEDDIRAIHAWLGKAPTEDPESRARHLALATTGPDGSVARALAEAASRARMRGAPAVAGELGDLAVERTPPAAGQRDERALAAAQAWFVAGDLVGARERAARILPGLSGLARARTLMLLGLVAWYLEGVENASDSIRAALPDAAGDPALEGRLHYYLSIFLDTDVAAARRHARRAADLLEHTSDRAILAASLLQAFHWSVALGLRPPLVLLRRGLAIEAEGPLTDRLTSPGIWWAGVGRLDRARERFQHLLDFDLLHGEYINAANLWTRLAEVEFWADAWPLARRHAEAAIEACIESGAPPADMALRARAMIDAHEGHVDEARAVIDAALGESERLGRANLSAAWLVVSAELAAQEGDPAATEYATALAWERLRAIGCREPLRLDPAPERIEALALLGRLDEAEAEAADLARRHRRVPKPWAAAALARGWARIALGRDDVDGALAATAAVAEREVRGWSRLHTGRVLLVRGEALRRGRRRREAANAIGRAERHFRDIGATVWAGRAAVERNRLGLSRSAPLALTPTESRVARLAGDGRSTREVAAALGISPRTVETHLASVYGKLGVTSRAELGRVMALREDA